MVISHKYKFIFLKTLKTAGTSLEVYLSALCADDDTLTPIYPEEEGHLPRNHRGRWNLIPELVSGEGYGARRTLEDWRNKRRFYNHIPARIARYRMESKVWNSYFKFAVERNPWDKTLSHYYMRRDRAGGRLSFEEYIEQGEYCLNRPIYCDKNGEVLVDQILRYEELANGLDDIFGRLGVPYDGYLPVKAKSGHRTNRKSYREVYSDEERDLVGRIYRSEIKMHGYQF